MDNEATPVGSAATSSTPATTLAQPEQQNSSLDTRVCPQGADDERLTKPLERTSSISEEYLRYLNNPENEEKRFPVDRKKLERLILVGGKDHENAESYFKDIEEQTGTLILWPSKLKIGAKSKKDPQVKVIGNPSSVQKARELILADLDAKATRVTLKIDIPFSEHSHVIGKEGCNIKKVHEETKCHIHFPDSNRSASAHGEKSNQVSITGQVSAVETARKRIRDLLPVVVTFSLAMPGRVDPNSYEIQQIMMTYNVNIHIKPQPRSFTMSVVVRGTVKSIDGVKLAVSKVIEYFTGDVHSLPMVFLNLEIAAQHHRTLIGHQGGNIKKIMQATDTVVQFPDPQSRYLTNQVAVNGTIDAIFNAREQLMGCLPVVLMFDVHESNENFLSSSVIGDLMQQLDVFISVKPKKGQIQSVIIKSIEQNLHCVYQARNKLLECSYQPTQAATPSDTIAIATSSEEPPMFQEKKVTGPLVPFSPISEESAEDVPSSAALREGIASLKPAVTETEARSASKSPDSKSEDQREVQFESSMEIGSEKSISPVEMRPRSQSAGQRTVTPTRRLTPRQFIDYDRKKEEAQKAMKSKVESSSPRFPTPKWAGYNFSESMPAGPRDQVRSPTSPSAVPQGLSSINRTGFQALARRASEERFLQRAEQDQTYIGVSDMPTLLQRLGLEHYQQRFDEEEVDFDTFLTMSESDFKEMGINTVGARRKLQIAISELKKVNSREKHQPHVGLGMSSTLGRMPYQNRGATGGGLNRGGSLKHGNFSMSHSGRF